MNRVFKTFEAKIARRLLLWAALLVVIAGFIFYFAAMKSVTGLYVENVHNRMLINYEYTRRVLSDVYVQVTNNVDYIEQTLDQPEGQKSIMERIVRNGNRVHSCLPGGTHKTQTRYSPKKKVTTTSTIWATNGLLA